MTPRSPAEDYQQTPLEYRRQINNRYSNLIGNHENLASTYILKNKIKRSSLDDKL